MFKKSIYSQLLSTMIVRGLAVVGGLLLGVVVGRLYGAGRLGEFSIVQAWIILVGVVSRFGIENSIIRNIAKQGVSWGGGGMYMGVSLIVAFCSIVLFCPLLIASNFNFSSSSLMGGVSSSMGVILCTVPFYALCFVNAAFLKAIGKAPLASLVENGGIATLTVFFILVIRCFDINDNILYYSLALSSFILFLCSFFFLACKYDYFYRGFNLVGAYRLMKSSSDYLITNITVLFQQFLSIIVAGFFILDFEVGLLKSAERVALMVGFVLMVVNSVISEKIANRFYNSDLYAIEAVFNQSLRFSLVVSLPVFIFLFVFPEFALSAFGVGFGGASTMLRILIVGQLFNILTGPVGVVLNMTENQRVMRNIAFFSTLIGALLMFVLIIDYGKEGAALSIALTIACQNIAAAYFCFKVTGIRSRLF